MDFKSGDIVTIKARVTKDTTGRYVSIEPFDTRITNGVTLTKDDWDLQLVERVKHPVEYFNVVYRSYSSRDLGVSCSKFKSFKDFDLVSPHKAIEFVESTKEVRYE